MVGSEAVMLRSARNVQRLIEERVPPDVREALRLVGEVADEAGFPVYLVGGIVRDLFLRVTNLDVDIVVEGDGIIFAGMLVKNAGGRMKAHQKFGTAVVVLPNGLKLDIATARLEYYESPAALPTVELSSIKKDLYRRDFTINTLAVRLNRKRYGELIDFFGGLRDIKEKTIRVLHSLSFVEDPTRVLRAIRFEQRFDFKLSKHTQNLIKSAVNMKLFNRLTGKRMYAELILLFSEAEPLKVLKRMKDLDLLKFIHPNLKATVEAERLFTGDRRDAHVVQASLSGSDGRKMVCVLSRTARPDEGPRSGRDARAALGPGAEQGAGAAFTGAVPRGACSVLQGAESHPQPCL